MNQGEKAKELIDKFLPLVEAFTEIGRLENAKKCALIAVDEMLTELYKIGKKNLPFDFYPHTNIEYWQEVKQEIKNYEPNI